MAEIIQKEQNNEQRSSYKKKKHSTFIDMTPMVDLMCLLITFFMLTTAFAKPKIIEITMPVPPKKGDPPFEIPEGRTINILLGENDSIYWYKGIANEKKLTASVLNNTQWGKDGIRKVLLNRNKIIMSKISELKLKIEKGEITMADSTLKRKIREIKKNTDPNSPIVLIKVSEKAKYRNVVDIVDEMIICNIASYAIVPMTSAEKKMIHE